MDAITISSKFQVVIPKKIRKQYNLKPGQKLVFIPYKNSLRVVIVPAIDQGYGFLEGIDTDVPREDEDRS
jgi:AbrB family looped-hinge helix DNA binding protein